MPDRAGLSSTELTLIDTVIAWEGLLEGATIQRNVPSEADPAGPTIDVSHLVEILVRASPAARAATARRLTEAVVDALEEGDVVAARAGARALLQFVEQLQAGSDEALAGAAGSVRRWA